MFLMNDTKLFSFYSLNKSTDEGVHIDVPTYESNIAITVVIGVFMVVGATGSLFTAVLIGGKKTLHTKANLFIFSLCLSDCISALICSPLWTYRRTWGFEEWLWGEFTCKFYWVSDFTTNYATSLHIASFSALRYVAVKHPFFVKKLKRRVIVFYICVLWIVAIAAATPLGFLMGVDLNRTLSEDESGYWPSCSIVSRNDCCVHQYQTYANIMHPLMFYVPEVLIITFSLLIVCELQKKKKWRERYLANMHTVRSNPSTPRGSPRAMNKNNLSNRTGNNSAQIIRNPQVASISESVSRSNVITPRPTDSPPLRTYCQDSLVRTESTGKEKGAFIQLAFIVIAYLFGYFPVTVYLMWTVATPTEDKKPETDYWFGVSSYMFLRLTECMNPVMYNLGASIMREETKNTLKRIFRCKRSRR